MTVVDAAMWGLGAYAAVGVVFGAAFVARGVGRVDAVALRTPAGVRVLWLPGAVALWPVLMVRLIRASRGGGST